MREEERKREDMEQGHNKKKKGKEKTNKWQRKCVYQKVTLGGGEQGCDWKDKPLHLQNIR